MSLLRNLPGDGAFWHAVFQAEPKLLEPEKPKKRAATTGEIVQMFKLRG